MKAGAAGLSGWLALVLLLPMEAGVPIPIPADLVMFTVGERVAAGAFPLWLAVAGFEAVSIIGTTVLFLACRGPAHRLVTRFGPRIGLSRARVSRGAALVERRGRSALAIGRGTPGLRTVTVLAAAASGLGWRRALPALILGSSVFPQLHLVLGLLLGPLAVQAFNAAKGRPCWRSPYWSPARSPSGGPGAEGAAGRRPGRKLPARCVSASGSFPTGFRA